MKIRHALALLAVAVISMLATAQPANSGLTAAEQLQLLKTNRELLEDLLDQGTRVSEAHTPLDRAAECQRSTDRLAREFRTAIDRGDGDRACEIGDHVEKIVVEGFVPNLETARRDSNPGSPDYERAKAMHRQATQNLDALHGTLPTDGLLTKSKRFQQLREKLAGLPAKLGKPE